MDLKATACSRFLVKRENFQTKISWNGALVWLAASIILRNSGRSAMRPLSASSTVLADYDVSVLLCMVPKRPQLCGDGEVHVLPVAGNPGVEGRRRVVMSFNHLFLPLVSSSWVWRERRICVRSCLRHSLSSR